MAEVPAGNHRMQKASPCPCRAKDGCSTLRRCIRINGNTTEIDPETMQRIERHRAMRADKGFDTVECYRHVEHIVAKRQDVLLLECMSNLLANEMYLEQDSDDGGLAETMSEVEKAGVGMSETLSPVSKKIVQALIDLSTRVQELVIVTNDVFSDGGSLTYDESTREYVKNLAEINCALAREAATVTEVVCGIPVIVKKNHPMGK